MKTIPDGLLDEMVERLVEEFDPEQVILFGSHAWGDPNEDSDIDLMVVLPLDETSPRDWMRRAIRCLRTVDVPNDVIVTTAARYEGYAHLRASLEHKVKNEGIVLYGPDADRVRRRVVREGRA